MGFGRNLRFAAVAFLLWSLAYNLMAPLLPLYARELGATPAGIGTVGAATALGALLLILPVSRLSDQFGPKKALVTGWMLSACGFALMWPARTLAALLPGAFLSAGALAALPALNALAIAELPRTQLARGFALLYAAAPLGALFGSALAGVLADTLGLRATVAAAAVSVATASLALLPLRDDSPRPGEQPVIEGTARPAGVSGAEGIVLALVAAGGFMMLTVPGSFIVPYLRDIKHQTLVATGLLTALLSAAQLVWSLLFSVWPRSAGHISFGFGAHRLTLPTATVQALTVCLAANALFGLILPARGNSAILIALLLRGSQYTVQSLGSSLLGDVLPAGPGLTTRLTLFGAALGLGAAAAPVVGGWLYGTDPAWPFRVTGIAAAVGTGVLLVFIRRRAAVTNAVAALPDIASGE